MNPDDFFRDVAFPWVVGEEGGLSLDPNDPGNWTGGHAGAGELKGTKYGVSAMEFPDLDIANLTLEQAQVIAWSKYYVPAGCNRLPNAMALCLFDFSYNAGIHEGVKVLQRAVGVAQDGSFGPQTQAAATEHSGAALVAKFTAAREAAYAQMGGFTKYGSGWDKRAEATKTKALSYV